MNPLHSSARRTGSSDDSTSWSEVIELPVDCTLRNLAVLKDRLSRVGSDVQNITLDLRRLERFDTATLQLIAAFTRDQALRGTNVMVCGNRPAWDEAAQLLGLTATLAGRS